MTIDRRAYFNLLCLHHLENPDEKVEAWQVENYRKIATSSLFDQLNKLGVTLDSANFHIYADQCDTPEDLTDQLSPSEEASDQIYLIIFELWRRLTPEKPSLSIFCDELDHLINLYNEGSLADTEHLESALSNLQMILDENTDQGADPKEVFDFVKMGSATDIEAFLYDFIATQIDEGNIAYATEFLENLSPYINDIKWFSLLKIRLLAFSDSKASKLFVRELVRKSLKDADLDFNLEILSFLIQGGEKDVFTDLLNQTLPLIETEGDFQDLLEVTSDYFRCLDQEPMENAIQKILLKRKKIPLENPLSARDPDLERLLQLLK